MRGNSERFSPSNLIDGDPATYWAADDGVTQASIEFTLPEKETFNRIRIDEYIALGQRVKSFEVDYHDGTSWKLLGKGTTINAHRILRTDTVTTDRVRLRITDAFACPVISRFSLLMEPLILKAPVISRNAKGIVTLSKTAKAGGVSLKDMQTLTEMKKKSAASLKNVEIYYTTDGSEPGCTTKKYTEPFSLPDGGTVKAVSLTAASQSVLSLTDPVATVRFGIAPTDWQAAGDSAGKARAAFDSDDTTFACIEGALTIDTGREITATGFSYLPRQDGKPDGTIELYEFYVSENGTDWGAPAASGRFDNIINSPNQRVVRFSEPRKGRYFRLMSKSPAAGQICIAETGIFKD